MPKLKKLESKSYGIHLEWEKIPGAERYRVYAHNGTGWVRLKDYEDTNAYFYAEDGLEYLYTVRCVDELGNLKSDFDHAGFDIIYHAAPEITSINNTSSGVRITWGARKGITKYRVFFDAGAGWKRITDTNKTEITYTGAQTGSVYYFTVRSLDSSGKFISDYLENNNFPLTYRAPSVTMIDENKIISQLSSSTPSRRPTTTVCSSLIQASSARTALTSPPISSKKARYGWTRTKGTLISTIPTTRSSGTSESLQSPRERPQAQARTRSP